MKSIWKFTLDLHGNIIKIPRGYKVLSVVGQYDHIVLYCLVNSKEEKVDAQFTVFGTGWELPNDTNEMKFIGTVSTAKGALIWHVFQDEQGSYLNDN